MLNSAKAVLIRSVLIGCCLLIAFGSATAWAAPNNNSYRSPAASPAPGPIYETVGTVRAPEPGRAIAVTPAFRTVFARTVRRTDIVEAPRPGRGRM